MRPYGKRARQDRLAKTPSPYIIYIEDVPTSTENERNHQPNLLLYILFIYGRMGCNLGLDGKSAKMLNLVMKIIFKMS